jgi:hypothetical protein
MTDREYYANIARQLYALSGGMGGLTEEQFVESMIGPFFDGTGMQWYEYMLKSLGKGVIVGMGVIVDDPKGARIMSLDETRALLLGTVTKYMLELMGPDANIAAESLYKSFPHMSEIYEYIDTYQASIKEWKPSGKSPFGEDVMGPYLLPPHWYDSRFTAKTPLVLHDWAYSQLALYFTENFDVIITPCTPGEEDPGW